MPRLPTCSLIVTTYNWERALDLVLASVERQRRLPDEVIVADDGSGPATAEVVARHAARLPIPVRHLWQEDLGQRAAAARNRGLAAAAGEYILLVDGDMILHPGFVRSHLAFARLGSYVQGGRVMLRAGLTQRLLAGERVALTPWASGIGNRANAVHAPVLSWLNRGPAGPARRTRSCNMAVWLADARCVNGFDEDMQGWGGEDIEFAARLLNAGVRRRNLKFGGVAYHLEHSARSSERYAANYARFERTVRERIAWCENGMSKYER